MDQNTRQLVDCFDVVTRIRGKRIDLTLEKIRMYTHARTHIFVYTCIGNSGCGGGAALSTVNNSHCTQWQHRNHRMRILHYSKCIRIELFCRDKWKWFIYLWIWAFNNAGMTMMNNVFSTILSSIHVKGKMVYACDTVWVSESGAYTTKCVRKNGMTKLMKTHNALDRECVCTYDTVLNCTQTLSTVRTQQCCCIIIFCSFTHSGTFIRFRIVRFCILCSLSFDMTQTYYKHSHTACWAFKW